MEGISLPAVEHSTTKKPEFIGHKSAKFRTAIEKISKGQLPIMDRGLGHCSGKEDVSSIKTWTKHGLDSFKEKCIAVIKEDDYTPEYNAYLSYICDIINFYLANPGYDWNPIVNPPEFDFKEFYYTHDRSIKNYLEAAVVEMAEGYLPAPEDLFCLRGSDNDFIHISNLDKVVLHELWEKALEASNDADYNVDFREYCGHLVRVIQHDIDHPDYWRDR